jgi:cellulose synthase/poly-beta-1,6-N-acetylglucosamine synthase-like glycosyltransferase
MRAASEALTDSNQAPLVTRMAPLVSAIMPAYNAEQTIQRTIRSVLSQTYLNLELVVVDDGSSDATRAIAEGFAREDARVRVLSKPNEGVARARNFGMVAAHGELIAPVDADDLWHPSKIEKQVSVLADAREDTAFVYTLFRTIDVRDHVLRSAPAYDLRGRVLSRHVFVNFVGNGSSMLMRRSAALEFGGYDASLQLRGAQGCEDLLLQLRMTSRYHVEVVPEYLVGYRRWPGSMSSDMARMARSYVMAFDELRRECPQVPAPAFGWGIAPFIVDQALGATRRGSPIRSLALLSSALRHDALGAMVHLGARIGEQTRLLRGSLASRLAATSAAPGQSTRYRRRLFHEYSPTEDVVEWPPSNLHKRRLARLASVDEAAPSAPSTRPTPAYESLHT